ncbi:sugar-specific transcriptional regulator TrmB [Methanolinea mesophila]|uniref:TrmB family transcriptional regulator n=1 Tax=Methanolinea mesophila TaxID=547055 RepID=UPI001AE7AD48|nr:helix-turn-helix domain-containing protein [Methanolinea mesophila]MBP1929323.1 sugar-specific transcriptional regulator TrmB [Methanolinea mesophila]
MTELSPQQLTIAESLKSLGLTKYEALVYIALLRVTGATATEIHEISGVPRASVYPVLDRLLQKNLVAVSHTTPKRFTSIPPDEGIDSLLKTVESDARQAKKILNKMYRERSSPDRGNQELIWSIYGNENIRVRLIDMISGAEDSVKIIFFHGFLKQEITEILSELAARISVEIITDQWDGQVPKGMNVHIKQGPKDHEQITPRSFAGGVFLVDAKKSMVLMGSNEEGFTALYSESIGFLRFFSIYWNFFSAWAGTEAQ